MNNIYNKYYFYINGLIIFICAAITFNGYLFFSKNYFQIGFPLDDAWIHQTFARNIALRFEWAFLPGYPTSGSTSPLWTVILSLGYILKIPYLFWTYFVGFIVLFSQAIFGDLLFRNLTSPGKPSFPWVGIFLIGEWHFVWAAASGMETLLLGSFFMVVFYNLSNSHPRYFLIGILCGASIWVRPEGITLLGPVLFWMIITNRQFKLIVPNLIIFLTGFFIIFIPYLLFNIILSGSLWPNTLYAKQAEYVSVLNKPFIDRLLSLLILPFIGAGALIFPGIFFLIKHNDLKVKLFCLTIGIWWLGFNIGFSLFLPLPYQHGRYVIPSMPVIYLLCLSGFSIFFSIPIVSSICRRVFNRVWLFSILSVWAIFYFLGAKSYSRDVAIIETENVVAAKWIIKNTKQEDIIAAHDIGALGYFGERKIIDLAGLISPEVIPIIRDEALLEKYLDRESADYLIIFPSWYPQLSHKGKMINTTKGTYSPLLGGENLEIYQWD